MASIAIRRAVEDDAQALSSLAERTFRAAFAPMNTAANMQKHCATSYSLDLQLTEILEPSRETWVAANAGVLVAFVQLRLNAGCHWISGDHPLEIQRFYVDAARHGAGLAHQLMAHVITRAEAAQSTVLWLGVWERNSRALAFYQKWGFTVVGDHIFVVGDDPQRDLVMRRSLEYQKPRST